MIGQNVPRTDGAAKVTGAAHYVDDLPAREGELFGVTVRSPIARGVLRGIVRDPTFDWSDVVMVTAADIENPVFNPGGANRVALIEDDQPILAKDQVRHVYEPVVLLACKDREKAERARAAITLQIDPLPPVLGIEASLRKDPLIFGNDNLLKHYRIAHGDVDAVIAKSEVILRGTYRVHHQEQLYIEPQGCIAHWTRTDALEHVHVIGSLQCPFYVHKALKKAFGLPDDRCHVEQAVTGGGFGGKEEYPSLVAMHAALLSRKSGHPVRMIYGRKEDIEATTKRHPALVHITSGCRRDGTFEAVRVEVFMDGGAYVTLTPVVLSRGALHACGAYRWNAHGVEASAVATSTPPNGAFRGFGAPQTIWAIERHVDAIAAELGLDPMLLRKKNLFREGDVTATGQELSVSVGGEACLEAVIKACDWVGRRANIERYNQLLARQGRRVRRGLGISTFMHGAGFTGAGERRLKGKVAVDLEPGGHLRVRSASTEIGQGTETVFRQIAASAAEVPMQNVSVENPNTSKVPDSGPTVASRTVMVVGSIVGKGAADIASRVRADMKPGESFAAAGDRLLARGTAVSSLQQYEPPVTVAFDEATYTGDAYPCFSWACDVVEIEIDLDTFETRVVKVWTAHDVGRVIHPIMCAGQVEGGTLQAIGWALYENVVWGGDGTIRNPRMTNYIVPTSVDAPEFETILVEVPFPAGPGGAKGVGELPMDGGAPAVAGAIEHALASVHEITLPDLPLLPENIFERLSSAPEVQKQERTS